MIAYVIEMVKNIKEKYQKKREFEKKKKIIIEEYLYPESMENMCQLAKIKSVSGQLIFTLKDIVFHIEPEDFEVNEFNLPFNLTPLSLEKYNEVKEEIKYSADEDFVFYNKLYRAFELADTKKNMRYFTKMDYQKFSIALKEAWEKFESIENSK